MESKKKLKKLKLNAVNERELAEKQMNVLKGGSTATCGCACWYANYGGSSNAANSAANHQHGYASQYMYQVTIYNENGDYWYFGWYIIKD
ncbi:MAG: TIGR04149 family rSAM-modified RiPP [Prevotellaceae bacterium]|jgi:natural product precursor|nr:TIGR04149 family rSAM-modified RiPP [Prevotellaceae bacterium]